MFWDIFRTFDFFVCVCVIESFVFEFVMNISFFFEENDFDRFSGIENL